MQFFRVLLVSVQISLGDWSCAEETDGISKMLPTSGKTLDTTPSPHPSNQLIDDHGILFTFV